MISVVRANQPNMVWITMEDTSPRFGCYGDKVARTPNIDRLAAAGTLYTHAYSTAAVCAPSRSAVITGMYQNSIGTMHMRTTHVNGHTPELPTPYEAVPPAYVKAFPEYLRAAGYYCTNDHKTDYQFEPPFTAWDESGVGAHWRNREEGQPFFAVFNRMFTHESGMWSHWDEETETDPAAVQLPPYLPDTMRTRKALAHQYDNIAKGDAFVGEVMHQLEKDGLLECTIVMLWSDHGEGMPRAKRWTYDAGIRVPMIVRMPGQSGAGQISDRLISLVDLAPTVLGLAGITPPTHLQGRSFLDNRSTPRTHIFATRDRYDEAYDKVRAVRSCRYKYIRNDYPLNPYLQWIPYSHQHAGFQEMWRLHLEGKLEGVQRIMMDPRPPEELYHCEEDPYEVRNLAGDPLYADVLQEHREMLAAWKQEYGDMGDIPESQMVQQMWPNGVQPTTAKPIIVPLTADNPGIDVAAEGSFEGPAAIMLHSATQGASIAYTIDEGSDARWRLYTSPIRLTAGTTKLRTKAVRIGYKDSEEVLGEFSCNSD